MFLEDPSTPSTDPASSKPESFKREYSSFKERSLIPYQESEV